MKNKTVGLSAASRPVIHVMLFPLKLFINLCGFEININYDVDQQLVLKVIQLLKLYTVTHCENSIIMSLASQLYHKS